MTDRPEPAEILRTLHHASMFVETYREWLVQTKANEEERQVWGLAQEIKRLIAFFSTLIDEDAYEKWLAEQNAKKPPSGT